MFQSLAILLEKEENKHQKLIKRKLSYNAINCVWFSEFVTQDMINVHRFNGLSQLRQASKEEYQRYMRQNECMEGTSDFLVYVTCTVSTYIHFTAEVPAPLWSSMAHAIYKVL